eukprot:4463091-Prymnesium_polylepis.1
MAQDFACVVVVCLVLSRWYLVGAPRRAGQQRVGSCIAVICACVEDRCGVVHFGALRAVNAG